MLLAPPALNLFFVNNTLKFLIIFFLIFTKILTQNKLDYMMVFEASSHDRINMTKFWLEHDWKIFTTMKVDSIRQWPKILTMTNINFGHCSELIYSGGSNSDHSKTESIRKRNPSKTESIKNGIHSKTESIRKRNVSKFGIWMVRYSNGPFENRTFKMAALS